MENKNLLLIGGGGHCKSVLDTLLSGNYFAEIGIIERKGYSACDMLGIHVIGCDEELEFFYKNGYEYAFITVGSIGNPKIRTDLYEVVKNIGFEIPNIIDKTSCVSSLAKLGKGIFIGKCAVVNAGSEIGDCAIINTGSVIEHDCSIGEFVHVAPGAVLSGNVSVGKNTHVGANSAIKQQIIIGSDTIIGMGSVVTKDIESHAVAYGNPCKVMKRGCGMQKAQESI